MNRDEGPEFSETVEASVRRQSGFSLIELLIVVAIILIIAAIAIPNYWKARMAANESAATEALRTITAAEVAYIAAYPMAGFGTLGTLSGAVPCTPSAVTACLIDNNLATATAVPGKSGYIYALVVAPADYEAEAHPVAPAVSGTRAFCATSDGVIRYNTTGNPVGSVPNCQLMPGLQ